MSEQTQGFRTIELNKGQLLFKEGQTGKQAFLIRRGLVNIFRIVDGSKLLIAQLKSGEIFGEMAVVTGEPRTASAEAASYVELIIIDEQSLHNVLSHMVPVAQAMLTQLITRFREMVKNKTTSIESLASVKKYEFALDTIRAEATQLENLIAQGDFDLKKHCKSILAICNETLK